MSRTHHPAFFVDWEEVLWCPQCGQDRPHACQSYQGFGCGVCAHCGELTRFDDE